MIGIVLIAIVTGFAAVGALWSYDPVTAVLCAPLIASFVTGSTALVIVLMDAAQPAPNGLRAQGLKLGPDQARILG
jgi:hypothetical protein